MKTELLAVHVASDPAFALDLGTFVMAEAALRTLAIWEIPSDLRANAPSPRVAGFESETHAAAKWSELEAGLDRSWTEQESIEGRYEAFCALSDDARGAWLGWAVARTLHAVPSGRSGSEFLDHLGRKLSIDVAAWWRPTARNYFDRITKPAILALFGEVGGAELRQRYAGSKKHDLATSAERLFAGDIIVEADMKAKAVAWLPPAMMFATDAPADQEQESGESRDEDQSVSDASEGDGTPLSEAA